MSLQAADSPLRVHLPAVPGRGAPIALHADQAGLGFADAGFEIVGRLRLHGRIERLDRDGFRLFGRLGGELRLECVRCLGDAALPLDEALDLVYLPQTANGSDSARPGAETALDESDMNVSFYEGDSLDLGDAVWEQIHLALPVKPLCSERCLGLCPGCGADRNRRTGCGCDDPAGRRRDTRLGALLAAG